MKNLVVGAAISVLTVVAFAAFAGTDSPYVGQEKRNIKAWSQQEVEDYLNGKGLGYARAAELNHYPGPRHVLDLARELTLTEEQRNRSQAIFDDMKAQAVRLGKQLVEKEEELEQRFASGSIDADSLKALVSDMGRLQGEIRYVHLSAHLAQKAVLTKQQIRLYDRLRGYEGSQDEAHKHAH